jgi:dTDP-4-dehydrorhamnose 3,5-epimerase
MRFEATALPGVVVIEAVAFSDDRGWFMESFHQGKFENGLRSLGLPLPRPFVQDNHSVSKAGTLRGLHFQTAPQAQGKLVRVTQGSAFDVAVDIRPESAHYGQWVGVELSAVNRRQMWIPEGFAHGFIALEDDTHFLYKTTDVYVKDCEGSIRWDDPSIGIHWPLPLGMKAPLLAPKDAAAPLLPLQQS